MKEFLIIMAIVFFFVKVLSAKDKPVKSSRPRVWGRPKPRPLPDGPPQITRKERKQNLYELAERLRTGDASQRRDAVQDLVSLGDVGLPVLRRAARDSNPEVSVAAIRGISQLHDAAGSAKLHPGLERLESPDLGATDEIDFERPDLAPGARPLPADRPAPRPDLEEVVISPAPDEVVIPSAPEVPEPPPLPSPPPLVVRDMEIPEAQPTESTPAEVGPPAVESSGPAGPVLDQLALLSSLRKVLQAAGYGTEREEKVDALKGMTYRFAMVVQRVSWTSALSAGDAFTNGRTVGGCLTDEEVGVAVSLPEASNEIADHLNEGDRIEVEATLTGWDGFYERATFEGVLI